MLPRFPRPFKVGLAASAVIIGLTSVALRTTTSSDTTLGRSDYTQDYLSAKAWRDGHNPYAEARELNARYFGPQSVDRGINPPGHRNPHPPPLILLSAPLAHLRYRTARITWMLITSALLALGIGVFARTLGLRRGAAAAVGVGALALPVAQIDLIYGQSNGFLVLLVGLGWRELRRGRNSRAGFAFGAATALKLFPAFLVIPLLRRRSWRAVLWQAGTAVAVMGAGMLLVGGDATDRFVTEAGPENFRFWRTAPMNISLIAIPFRWLTPHPWRPDSAFDVPGIAALIAVVAAGACIFAAFKTPARLSGDVFLAAFPWMLLASPLAWDHYALLVVGLLMAVAVRAQQTGHMPPALVVLAAAVVLVGPPPGLPAPLVRPFAPVAQLFGFALPTYALIVLGSKEWSRDLASAPTAVTAAMGRGAQVPGR